MSMPKTRNRNFTFTDFELLPLEDIFNNNQEDIRAIAWSQETCPTTGRKHYQGFIQLYTASRFGKIKKLLGDKAHIEAMRGSIMDNELYCQKEATMKKLGIFTKQGKRMDIDGVKSMITNGATMADIMDKAPDIFLKYHSGLEKMKAIQDTRTRSDIRNVTTTVLIGLPGTGKTYSVYQKHKDDLFIVDSSRPDAFPFNGYEGESAILLDDFYGWLRYSYLLRVLDVYKLQLNIKGGRTMANWTNVYITSNVRPTYWYSTINKVDALARRISSIHEVIAHNDGTPGLWVKKDTQWGFDRILPTPYEDIR